MSPRLFVCLLSNQSVVPATSSHPHEQMEWTDRHYRFLMRSITRRTQLYTEMVVDGTVGGWMYVCMD